MKRNVKITALATGAAAVVAGVLAVGPVSAAADNGPTPAPTSTSANGYGPGWMMGGGSGRAGMMGGGSGYGPGWMTGNGNGYAGMMGGGTATAASGTLTSAQKTDLAGVAEQTQLARDLYQAFAAKYGNTMFDHLSDAASHQLDAVRTLMTRYSVTDPTAGKTAGTFADKDVQATYDRLLAQGNRGYTGALDAARTLEQSRESTLKKDLTGLSAPDVQRFYNRLSAMSEMRQGMFAH